MSSLMSVLFGKLAIIIDNTLVGVEPVAKTRLPLVVFLERNRSTRSLIGR